MYSQQDFPYSGYDDKNYDSSEGDQQQRAYGPAGGPQQAGAFSMGSGQQHGGYPSMHQMSQQHGGYPSMGQMGQQYSGYPSMQHTGQQFGGFQAGQQQFSPFMPGTPMPPPPQFVQQAQQPFSPFLQVPGMLPIEMSYIENILRLNRGKVGTFYMTFENNDRWNAKIFKGVIEAAGRDHIIISDPQTDKRYLLLMVNLDYVTFDEEIEYDYPFDGAQQQMAAYAPR
ncbi:spore coat protein GerQ [Salipaludibacillus aurantiacus]|uniref:Spore coat protein GerQ n=1 Tax=Salipaludibacillus aurantiacus TaxID=1601833 RepID=A0A1H9VBS9_9BACI|nr:spore coat protein GerQ [Salipaludibacillus aurantiacus]SES18697.1 spore coat protein GerQ [Salipaludibacillus aurantiacus]